MVIFKQLIFKHSKNAHALGFAFCALQFLGLALPGRISAAPQTIGNKSVFNVLDFGAKGDGKTLDSPAINRALEGCAKAGGGTVYFPAGTYLSGSLHLKSHLNLYLDAGATLWGASQEMNAYDPAEPFEGKAYQDEGHTYFHNSLLWGENLVNVSITGTGTINGGGLMRDDDPLKEGGLCPANKAVALKLCRQVLVRDVTIAHGGHFAILVTGCDNLMIDNVTIDTNRDGIDIDCCRNVMVSNCRINSPHDDGICPKSSFALGRPVTTENLAIVNCQVSGFEEGTLLDGSMVGGGCGRIKFGTESNGGFRNVTVSNCVFRNSLGLALEEVDGGVMENINISNITMMDIRNCPIYITLGKRNRGPKGTADGTISNILISNVVATGIDHKSGIQITGMPGDNVEGVRLQNIRLQFNGGGKKEDAEVVPSELGKDYPEPGHLGVMPAYGLFARHARNLELSGIEISFKKKDLRPAIVCVDVDGLQIDGFKAQVVEGVQASKFEDVKGLVIRDSPTLQGSLSKNQATNN